MNKSLHPTNTFFPKAPEKAAENAEDVDLQTYLRNRHTSCIKTLTRELLDRAEKDSEISFYRSLNEEWQHEKMSILRGLHHHSSLLSGSSSLDASYMKKRGRESDLVVADAKHFAPAPQGKNRFAPATRKTIVSDQKSALELCARIVRFFLVGFSMNFFSQKNRFNPRWVQDCVGRTRLWSLQS